MSLRRPSMVQYRWRKGGAFHDLEGLDAQGRIWAMGFVTNFQHCRHSVRRTVRDESGRATVVEETKEFDNLDEAKAWLLAVVTLES